MGRGLLAVAVANRKIYTGRRIVLASVHWRLHTGHMSRNGWYRNVVYGLHRVGSHIPTRFGVVMVNVRAASGAHSLRHAVGVGLSCQRRKGRSSTPAIGRVVEEVGPISGYATRQCRSGVAIRLLIPVVRRCALAPIRVTSGLGTRSGRRCLGDRGEVRVHIPLCR